MVDASLIDPVEDEAGSAFRSMISDSAVAPAAMAELLDGLSEARLASALDTHAMPDPALVILTSGETRVSNFLLCQAVYAENAFTPTLWPDFTPEELARILDRFAGRERRFGAVK